jgi:hypothetical protein
LSRPPETGAKAVKCVTDITTTCSHCGHHLREKDSLESDMPKVLVGIAMIFLAIAMIWMGVSGIMREREREARLQAQHELDKRNQEQLDQLRSQIDQLERLRAQRSNSPVPK